MSDEKPTEATRPRTRHPDRVTLTPESLEVVDHWLAQITDHLSGKRLIRSELVNWLIARHAADLSEDELAAIHAQHFDPVKALEWAARRAREAQARGEAVDIKAFVTPALLQGESPGPRRRQRRKKAADAEAAHRCDGDLTSETGEANEQQGV